MIKSRILKWEGHVARKEESGSDLSIFIDTSKPTEKRHLGRSLRR
jgi:hypothetical protein